MSKGILEGVTVLDLGRVLATPYCGMLLADMGARVIKIELPGREDDSRKNGPFKNGESAYFMNVNRNKEGITLNLKSEEGKKIFKDLVRKADIVIENYRPGVMKKLGLDYEVLREINPAIVYGAASGFGQYGPYSSRAGYDIIGQAMSGMMSTTGWPTTGPTRCGTAISDILGGLNLTIGVLAAYVRRQKTGLGDMVDVSLVDSTVSAMEIINMIYLIEGRTPSRIGNRYEAIYPYDSFEAKDGQAIIACGNDKLFGLLKGVIGDPDLEAEEFSSNALRVKNNADLKPIVEKWTRERSIDEITEVLLAAGIPASPINTIDRVVKDPHIAGAREMFVEMEHPVAGKITVTGNQLKFTNNGVHVDTPAPLLGQDTERIFAEIGIGHDRFEQLKADGVI